MLFSALSTIAILATSVAAAPLERRDGSVTVTIKATNDNISTGSSNNEDFYIPLGQLTKIEYEITKLEVTSSQSTVTSVTAVDVAKVICQRYTNEYGTLVGSGEFTSVHPALVSTNPIDAAYVLCYVTSN